MTSGALYQRVTTYPVISESACLAKPKSKIYSSAKEERDRGSGEKGKKNRTVVRESISMSKESGSNQIVMQL